FEFATTRRNAFPLWKKKEVLDWVNTPGEGTPSHAVPYFCERVDPGPVRRWWCKRDEILGRDPHQQRMAGGGRKKALGVLKMIVLRRLKKETVTREWIAIQALQIHG
ncbi:hypothetical protein JG688_00017653, partial [Phytophthora aleatoria]